MIKKIRGYPRLSTFCAAVALSLCWTTVWLFVFFVSTWILGIRTGAIAFIMAYWLSVAAESVIRWAENTRSIARLSKPHDLHARGDNEDYSWGKAVILLLLQLLVIIIFLFLANRIPEMFAIEHALQFYGQVDPINPQSQAVGLDALYYMFENWGTVIGHEIVLISLIVGFLFRVAIYKRSHKLVRES